MRLRGECLACSMLGECNETNVDKVLVGYTCQLFREAPEPVYTARVETMQEYGDRNAVLAMLKTKTTHQEEEPDV
jgi:hypothetical protein